MLISRNLRVKDKRDFFYKNRKDFLVREFGISSRQVVRFLITTLLIIISVTFCVSVVYRYIETFDSGVIEHAWMLYGCLTLIFVGGVLYLAARQVSFLKEALDATEFMNALFSSALSEGHKFCMIVAQADSRIFYVDKAFQSLLPEVLPLANNATLDNVLDKYGVTVVERDAVLQAAKQTMPSQVKLHLQGGSDKKEYAFMVSVEPIKRPAGFCLIRGRIELPNQ